MGFASQVKGTVELESRMVTIRKLGWRSLDSAVKAKHGEALADIRILGPELFRELKKIEEEDPEKIKKARANIQTQDASPEARYGKYDQHTVLLAGIEEWISVSGVDLPDLPQGIDELSPSDATKVFRGIVDLSDPTPEEAEAARSKD